MVPRIWVGGVAADWAICGLLCSLSIKDHQD
jgi:hypothetical protein